MSFFKSSRRTLKRPAWMYLPLWQAAAVSALGLAVGLLSLAMAASAYPKLPFHLTFPSYFANPLLLLLNLLPPAALVWGFFLLSRRGWAAFLGGYLPVIGFSLVNYFKLRLRSDPLTAADLNLASEAGNIVKKYTLDFPAPVVLAMVLLPVGLVLAWLLAPEAPGRWPERFLAGASCLALTAVAAVSLYVSPQVYERTASILDIDRWSATDAYVSRGFVYPFLHSFRVESVFSPQMWMGLEQAEDQEFGPLPLEDADIPAERRVSVMGIMLEAFCDLTDFELLGAQEGVQAVYAPWHALEAESITGNLLTNVFAGGTIQTEREFLTGLTGSIEFERPVDSYVWYLRGQGYQTFGSHPSHEWFYNRKDVNEYMGFEEYWFGNGHYEQWVDPEEATWASSDSDWILAQELVWQLQERIVDGPCFSFSVSAQNHGPYTSDATEELAYLSPEGSGLDQEPCNIFNNYLMGIRQTICDLEWLRDQLEAMEEPVVLVLFGDHKPWGGNGNSAYRAIGAEFDLDTLEGFYQYYSTPYLIWGNAAAKEVLGEDFTGRGRDVSPCFLMNEVFDLCGWPGPVYMELARRAQASTPLLHNLGLYWQEGAITDHLSPVSAGRVGAFLSAQPERRTFDAAAWLLENGTHN